MNAVVFASLGLFVATLVALWICAIRDLRRSTFFSDTNKTIWFVVIVLVPVGGPIAYFSARNYIERYSRPAGPSKSSP